MSRHVRRTDSAEPETGETAATRETPVEATETSERRQHAHDAHDESRHRDHTRHPDRHDDARDRFGGTNLGAVFFGWLVAVGVTVLLVSIIGAVASAVGSNASITQSDAERSAGTIGIAAAITLLVVLMVAYYAGGYVAGRMSRFDGGRQGTGVWVLGFVITLIAVGLGALFGNEYNLLDRVDLPRVPLSGDELGWGGIITAVAVLVGSFLAALFGGKVGRHYHDKVDRAIVR